MCYVEESRPPLLQTENIVSDPPPQNYCSVSFYHRPLSLPLSLSISVDRLCGPVVWGPGYWMEMYCASCEVQT
jgi:hypothetical protein